ncbi:MAG: membrane dipeptidase [Chloroflexi bacterium]|nr:membrane dipeptidase [Chloroflexota bacterium]MCY4246703.1 membrane dipeptidase [Chloroflexota bacterium]
MLIVDGHLDLSWNALQWNRDLRQSAYTIRANEAGLPGKGRAANTVALPEMRRGRVGLCFATLLARSTSRKVAHLDFESQAQAYGIAQGQLAYYRGLELAGHARIIENAASLRAHIAEWDAWEAAGADQATAPPLGFVIAMEGADPIRKPDQLAAWREAGLRLLGPTHYGPGRYAGGTGTELGLTELGAPLLREMTRLGILLDMTHLSDQAFWEAAKRYEGPLLASHNNCRALAPHQRQFSDEQLQFIIGRGGVVGAAFDVWMLQPGFTRGESNQTVVIDTVIDHIDHICQLAGNSKHAAIGSDLDGGFGREQSPCDLDTIADFQRLPGKLAERGYTADDIADILHGNWLRLLFAAWDD